MLVRRVMTKNPVYVHPDMSVSYARSLMDREHVFHLPVIDADNHLIGIVTKRDMLKAGPSPATTLDMYEISYLLSKLTVDKVMTKKVFTTGENEVIEEAARTMADNSISCLPVVRGRILVGIVTVKDLFVAFISAFGTRHPGVRVSCVMQDKPGQMAKLFETVSEKGGNILSFVTHEGDYLYERGCTVKISGLDIDAVRSIFEKSGAEILDIR
jgi:acetoin utilization protein AcuB